MLNRSASLAMSASVLKALPGKLDIKTHSPSILYIRDISVMVHVSQYYFTVSMVLRKLINHIVDKC